MWSDYLMEEILGQRSPVGRLRTYDSPLSMVYRIVDAVLIFTALWATSLYTGLEWSLSMTVAAVIATVLFYMLAGIKHLYRSWRTERVSREILYVTEAWLGVAGLTLVAVYVLQDSMGYPPATMALWCLVTPALLVSWRIAVRLVLREARVRGYNSRKLAIAGSGELARHVARVVDGNPWMGFRIVGLFDNLEGPSDDVRPDGRRVRSLDIMVDLARRGDVDAVYMALPAGRSERSAADLIGQLSDSTASVYLVQDRRSRAADEVQTSRQVLPDLRRFDVLHRTCMDIAGIKAVSIYESPFMGQDRWIKRMEDIVISGFALMVLAIPMAIIATGVKLSGPGPVLFKQRRYGLDGRQILVWKFRSMNVCEDGDKVTQASRNDNRVTPFGAFIRRTSLDELPQFFNVFGGTMSIVGPRPHAVAHNEYYRGMIGGYMLRHKVKPGITGWAQINGWRGETDSVDKMGRRIDYDLDYIRNWSLLFDLQIIFMTAFKGFIQKNAY